MSKNGRFLVSLVSCLTMIVSLLFPFVLFPGTASAATPDWKSVFSNPDSWFGSSDGIALADSIVQHQLADGGWKKDMTGSASGSWGKSTIDNDTTTSQIMVLAKTYKQTNDSKYLTSLQKGIDLLINGQYANGGWPQIFDDAGTYHAHITYNDNAMINVITLLTDVSKKTGDFTFIDSTRASQASTAVAQGIQCILDTQITSNGIKTAWGQQHDEVTLLPTSGRSYELASTSSSESVGIVKHLKTISNPSVEVTNAINSAITWLDQVKIEGIRVDRIHDSNGNLIDVVVVEDSSASPIWARFYELDTDVPVFFDRDSSTHYQLSELSDERRLGYAWYGYWPDDLISAGYVYYTLINRNSGKYLDVQDNSTANGGNVHQWTDNGHNSQQWLLVDLGNGYYKLMNRNSGKLLDVSGKSTADGGEVIQWTDNGGSNQQWQLIDTGSGYYQLENRNSGKVLDVYQKSTADGGNVVQWTDNDGSNQQWQLVVVP